VRKLSQEYRAIDARTHDSVAHPRTFAARRAWRDVDRHSMRRAIARVSITIDTRKHRRLPHFAAPMRAPLLHRWHIGCPSSLAKCSFKEATR